MISFIRNLIKRGTVSRETVDSGKYSIAQIKWGSDKVGDVEVLYPYGYSANPTVGSLAIMFNVFGNEENRAAIINNPPKRFRKLKPGEVAIGNPSTRSVIKFLENGDIEITGKADQNFIITGDVNLTVGGNTNINTTGNISATIGGTLTANVTGNTDITSPFTTIHGALRATGEVTAFYGTVGALTFTNLISKYNAHAHTSATAGNPTSATLAPNTLP